MTDPLRTLLILDLDETLVYASERLLDREPDHLVGPYFVYHRPHLHEFLINTAEHFDLAVWSSSSTDYANAIVHLAFPSQVELRFVWGRDRCVLRYDGEKQTTYYVKDLRKVERHGYDLQRVLIVDDTPQKCERNYGNAVYVPEFFGDPNDTILQPLAAYLVTLANATNVRIIEKRNWKRHS